MRVCCFLLMCNIYIMNVSFNIADSLLLEDYKPRESEFVQFRLISSLMPLGVFVRAFVRAVRPFVRPYVLTCCCFLLVCDIYIMDVPTQER